jgi:hypothetical protein
VAQRDVEQAVSILPFPVAEEIIPEVSYIRALKGDAAGLE